MLCPNCKIELKPLMTTTRAWDPRLFFCETCDYTWRSEPPEWPGEPIESWFISALVHATEAATSAGMRDEKQAFELLFIALGLSDRNSRHGCSRATFLTMAGMAYDKCRAALAAGPES
jgi:hypothetical protein